MSKKASHTITKRCTKDRPMPDGKDGMTYIHDFETIEEGVYVTVMQCRWCGFEVKASPKR